VRIVVGGIEALHPALRDVGLVCRGGLLGRERGVVVTAHAQVDVRRHVHEMAGAWHEIAQPIGGHHAACGIVRLDGMDVVVERSRVARREG